MKAGVVTVAALTLYLGLTGCSTAGSDGASDCNTQVRVDGITYTSVGLGIAEHEATKFSTAELADCDDVGKDARGSVFPEHPRQVNTWKFPGYPASEVVGIRFEHDSLTVLVADSIPREERDQIFEDLGGKTS